MLCPLPAQAVAFVDWRYHTLFAVRGGKQDDVNDYDRAEKAIFHVIEKVESMLQKVVQDEVHSIFDEAEHHHHRLQVTDHVSKAVSKGSGRIKEMVQEHVKARGIPFLPVQDEYTVMHDNHKILHAVEAAEKAVLHAVQEEVDILFSAISHEEDHPLQTNCAKTASKTKEVVQKGLEKTKEHVDDAHNERRRWMREMDAKEIDMYLKSTRMYGLGF
jgi:gas vesicle protein